MRIVHTLCAGFLIAATPAISQGQQGGESKDSKADKIICKRSIVTGSLAQTSKLCGTRKWWEERTRRSREWLEAVQDGSRGVPIPPPG